MQFSFFGGMPGMEMLELELEVKLGDAIINSQVISGPYIMVYNQCQNLIEQLSQDERPMKLTMKGTKVLELPNGNTTVKPSKLIYANNAYANSFEDIEK